MTELLTKLGLVDHLTVELPIEKMEYVQRLRQQVDAGGNDFFEVFSSSKNVYKGRVDLKGFELRKRRRFFDMRRNYSKATGTFTQLGGTLRIETVINGFHWSLILLYVVAILAYVTFFVFFLMADHGGEEVPNFVLPFILVHALLMLGLPYLFMRRNVKWMKHDLERELHFVMQGR